ncbi:MAG: PAS domain S-box protein [bacterium]|nr:PAS domain S-box protein [bacterium]
MSQAINLGDMNFRILVETISDIILIADLEGRLIYANPATTAILGYESRELDGMAILDMHPAPVREEATRILAEMFAGTRTVCPLPLQRKDGSLVPVETRIWKGRWNGADCIFGFCKDLTREQEALQKFDRFFRMNPALMAVNRVPERTFHDVNDAFLRALGYAADEVIGKSAADLGLFVDQAEQDRLSEHLREHGSVREIELQVRAKDGRVLDGLFSGDLIHSQGTVWFLTVMIDITERQRTVRELRAALAEIRELQRILPICSGCKKIRDDDGYWQQVDTYLTTHTGAQFSHGMCPDCMDRLYPEYRKSRE